MPRYIIYIFWKKRNFAVLKAVIYGNDALKPKTALFSKGYINEFQKDSQNQKQAI